MKTIRVMHSTVPLVGLKSVSLYLKLSTLPLSHCAPLLHVCKYLKSAEMPLFLLDAEDFLSCSHSRSIFLFLESINSPCPLYGHPCHDMASLETNEGNCMDCGSGGCPLMGYNADQTNARGKYYPKARATKPYCG